MSSPRNRFTGLPELITSPLCHYCGIEVDILHDILETPEDGGRAFHYGCYIDYTGNDPAINDVNLGEDEDE